MSWLCSLPRLSLRNHVRSSVILERLREESVLLCPTVGRLQGRPRTQWRDYISKLAWECLGVSQGKLEEVAREREVWVCPQDSTPDKQNKMN